ncbi:MAG: hypothetical protein M5U26_21005 [Planctomycetota bacterium]|nr:hypothetical protein [Planctomycetota bacterium]
MNSPAPQNPRAELLLNRHLDGELTPAEAAEWDRLVAEAPAVRREFERARRLDALLMGLSIPDSARAKTRTMSLLAKASRRRKTLVVPFVKTPSVLKPAARRSYKSAYAAAALVLVAVGLGAGLFWAKTGPRDEALAAYRDMFEDRVAVWEALNRDLLAAMRPNANAAPPAEAHEALADHLLGTMLLERRHAQLRNDAALAYARVLHRGLIPAIREGRMNLDRVAAFQRRLQALEAMNPDADSTLAAAEALTAYGIDLLEGKTSAQPLVTLPPPGTTVLSRIVDAALELQARREPDRRAELLDGLARRLALAAEEPGRPPAEVLRVHRLLAALSVEGLQPLAALADSPAQEARLLDLLRDDGRRLAMLERAERDLPPTVRSKDVSSSVAAALKSNAQVVRQLTEGQNPAESGAGEPGAGAAPEAPRAKAGPDATQKTEAVETPPQAPAGAQPAVPGNPAPAAPAPTPDAGQGGAADAPGLGAELQNGSRGAANPGQAADAPKAAPPSARASKARRASRARAAAKATGTPAEAPNTARPPASTITTAPRPLPCRRQRQWKRERQGRRTEGQGNLERRRTRQRRRERPAKRAWSQGTRQRDQQRQWQRKLGCRGTLKRKRPGPRQEFGRGVQPGL